MDNITNRNIFVFWTGDNPLTVCRRASIETLQKISDANVIIVTPDKYKDYIVEGHPFHPAFEYLSLVHKSDYLRTYFMHHHGGGYSDIKAPLASWAPAFQDMIDNPEMWINGYKEAGEWCVYSQDLIPHWRELIGNGAYIVRPNTPFTTAWYTRMNALLDTKLEALREHPADHPRACAEEGRGYPIAWSEMLSRIFHQVCFEYKDRILQTFPGIVMVHYQ